jgi:hypothetical protein
MRKVITWVKELDATVLGLAGVMAIAIIGMAACAVLFIYYVSKLVI